LGKKKKKNQGNEENRAADRDIEKKNGGRSKSEKKDSRRRPKKRTGLEKLRPKRNKQISPRKGETGGGATQPGIERSYLTSVPKTSLLKGIKEKRSIGKRSPEVCIRRLFPDHTGKRLGDRIGKPT